jgi:PIN domain nuclease of toxin-antitoxin system
MSKRFLLDTQVLAWLVVERKRIGKEAMRFIERNDIYFSTPSIAELNFKRSLGKFNYSISLVDALREAGFALLNFDLDAANAFGRFSAEWVPDPFDRQIMAVAAANNLILITSDRKILSQGFDWVLDATT